jgi:hypothetical protein
MCWYTHPPITLPMIGASAAVHICASVCPVLRSLSGTNVPVMTTTLT